MNYSTITVSRLRYIVGIKKPKPFKLGKMMSRRTTGNARRTALTLFGWSILAIRPHPQDIDDVFFFVDLVHETALDVNSARIGST